MKKLLLLLPIALGLIFLQSCEEDPIVTPLGPDISFTAGGGSITLNPGETFTVTVTATTGDAELNGFILTEDGGPIDVSRIMIEGQSVPSSSLLLTGDQRNGFTFEIDIVAHDEADITRTYAFQITDDNQNTDQVSLDVSTEKVPSTLSFVENPPYFWMDAMVPANQLFRVKLTGLAGSSPMNFFTVLEDDVAVDVSRLEFNGVQPAENPLLLSGTEQDSFCYDMFIRAHDSGVSTYAFEIADADGEVMRVSFDISAGTPVDSQKVVLLLNAGGGTGTGGVNLITGQSTGSSDTSAHLVDRGIYINLPMANNWIKKIAPGPDAELRVPGANAPEGFSFTNATTKEIIQAAFDTGDVITETEVVTVNDLLLVLKNGTYFLVQVNAINETIDNNEDSYELEVKF